TEQCIIPYATQEGEISFCAYNTGVGWRNIVEKMHMTATLTKWYQEHGRHEIYAGGRPVELDSLDHSMVLREELITNEIQHDLDELGIAKNAREEKLRAQRDRLAKQKEHDRMMKLYKQVVLNEPTTPDAKLVQLNGLKKKEQPSDIQPAGFGD
ncbi:MAG: radical SAM protein, partial [Blastocatellia bacterium]